MSAHFFIAVICLLLENLRPQSLWTEVLKTFRLK
jgi:hypothetical protein